MKNCLLLVILSAIAFAADDSSICAPCIRAHEHFLASDALRGRGSATSDELVAAEYIASELEQYGLQPAANGSYIQTVEENVDLSQFPFDRMSPQTAFQMKHVVGNGKLTTRNVLAVIPGSDEKHKDEVILLSSHLDHVGVIPDEALTA